MMRRHILHVIESADPAAGGPSEAVRALLQFAPEGYTAEVVTLDDPAADFLGSYPAPVHGLGAGLGPVGYSAALDRWLRANRGRFDGAIVHGLWRYVGFATRRAFRGYKPYLVFPHGMLDPYFKRRFPLKHLSKWPYWLLSEYHVLRDARQVLFTTDEEASLAEQSFFLHRWNPYIVALGAILPETEPDVQLQAFAATVPAAARQRFLLFLGRIHRKKGCDLLIEAFLKTAATKPDLHLVMAGPDQQGWSASLKEQVAAAGLTDRVHWPGMLRGEVKWGAFRACEAFVLPSHQENFGIAVAEALSCERPVLLSDKVNIAPEIAAAGAGLMEPDTQAGTDRLLTRWLALDAGSRDRMRTAAGQCFRSRYDMRTNAARILRLFDETQA